MIIRLTNISKIYKMGMRYLRVLNNVSLEIAEGSYTVIMGQSGSGKSTLLNVLGCLDQPDRGHYFLDSEEVATLDSRRMAEIRRQKIGFIFQTFNLIPRVSALENVILPLIYNRRPKDTYQAYDLLARVGLADRAHHFPNQLSGGERQRVAIARALVNDPRIILADEPTGNLDSKSGEQILQIISDLHTSGKTVVVVTHDSSIASLADTIIHIKDGQIESREHR